MTKDAIVTKLNGMKRDILDYSYTEDWDGDDETGAPIVRQVYTGMTEEDLRNILDKIETIIYEIKEVF